MKVSAYSQRGEDEISESSFVLCRNCKNPLKTLFFDFGNMPLANGLLSREDLLVPEPAFPLRIWVCDHCFLVQAEDIVPPEKIFSWYPFYSSISHTWQDHIVSYSKMITRRFSFRQESSVVEIGSNDGALLNLFQKRGFRVLGIEPAKNLADAALHSKVFTVNEFFSSSLARELKNKGWGADLLIANNVLANIPHLHDFLSGTKILLKVRGIFTLEFQHLLSLVKGTQFDTMYHEHFSYFSLIALDKILRFHKLEIFDVEEIPTHGGSLRLFVRHAQESGKNIADKVGEIKRMEREAGLNQVSFYQAFSQRVQNTRDKIEELVKTLAGEGYSVAAYGAAAKATILLNYCRLSPNEVEYCVDLNPEKQGRWIPGCRVPVFPTEKLRQTRPAFLLILPWNLKEEIIREMAFIREWGGKFIIPIPEPKIET